MPAAEEKRDLMAEYDSAFDRAVSQAGESPVDDGEPQGREASDPTPVALRAVAEQDPEAAVSDDDPVAAKLRERLARDEERTKQTRDASLQRSLDRVQKHGDFLDDIESNAALRQHILEFWNKGDIQRDQSEPPQNDDPLADYDEKDRSALSKLLERHEAKLMARMEQMFEPVRDQFARSAADHELTTLKDEAPDWETWAKPEELKAVRAQFPGLSLTAAYRIVSQPRIRARVSRADKQMAKVSDVLSRKAPAESQPRRHVKVDKRETSWDDAFDKAYAQMKAAFGQPRG